MESPAPNDKLTCPLCKGDNACAIASSGNMDEPCWCRKIQIDTVVIEQVPKALQAKVCICINCACPVTNPDGVL